MLRLASGGYHVAEWQQRRGTTIVRDLHCKALLRSVDSRTCQRWNDSDLDSLVSLELYWHTVKLNLRLDLRCLSPSRPTAWQRAGEIMCSAAGPGHAQFKLVLVSPLSLLSL